MSLRGAWFWPVFVLAACAHHAEDEPNPEPPSPSATSAPDEPPELPPVRAQLNGRAFPEGVLALTWDDGPDLGTLALAEYLQREHVSATFFTVHDWEKGVSSDPGFGAHVYDTGYEKLPVLGKLVALGHRVGNHTLHHALLGRLPPPGVEHELGDAQRAIDPFVGDEMRFFRVPGGDWTASASRAVDGDPYLANLVGPVRWDVDAKDWEGAVWCEASPAHECEHTNGQYRVRADVMALRYERAIAAAGHGIVLMHDRVGDVGSHYALDLAEHLVPWLALRGYVFSAPVLGFAPGRTRWPGARGELVLGDIDGDGRADACTRDGERVLCARSTSRLEDGLERAFFDRTSLTTLPLPPHATSLALADVDGDGRADLCVFEPDGVSCALSLATGGFGAFELWSGAHDTDGASVADFSSGTVRFADVDGDHRADVCGRSPAGVVCARSTGKGFERARVWLSAMSDASVWGAGRYATTMALGDVDGDGRADVCASAPGGVYCALSKGTAFGPLSRWSTAKLVGSLALGDLNGDGRADVCASGECALSDGHALTQPVGWLDEDLALRAQWAPLGDINGDGRSDICGFDERGLRCAVAP